MQFFQGWGAAWETLGLDVESVSEAGEDLVVGIVRSNGTLRGGGPSGYDAMHIFTIRGSKITRLVFVDAVGTSASDPRVTLLNHNSPQNL